MVWELDVVRNINEVLPNFSFGGNPISEEATKFKYIFALNGRPTYYCPDHAFVTVYPFDDTNALPPEDDIHYLAKQALACSKKGPTLVHCSAGLNRSGLITGLALMYGGMTAEQAILHMRRKRSSEVLFNTFFYDWLLTAQLQ